MHIQTYIAQHRVKEIIILLPLAILGFWLWVLFSSRGLLDFVVPFLENHAHGHVFLASGIFFAFAVFSVLLGPFTSAPIVPLAIIVWGEWTTFLLLLSGWVVGGVGTYCIGAFVGYPIVAKIVSKERAELWRGTISSRMTFPVAFLFRFAMPAETGYMFGLVRYHFWKYFLITFMTEAPLAAVVIRAGDALVANDFLKFAGWIFATVFAFAVGIYFFQKAIHRPRAET